MTLARTNVVIITYNALPYTKATLESLFQYTNHPFNLTIIDNGSRHDTINFLKELEVSEDCKKYTLILNDKNLGVGAAYTQGQHVSFQDGTEFTAFCNNDLYFSLDWLVRLESTMDTNRNLAMLSPLRPSAKVSYDGTISTRDALFQIAETENWMTELVQYTGRNLDEFNDFCDQIIKSNLNGGIEFISFPDSLSTCVCLTRNEYFKELDRFADPLFENYGGEDIDMTWTIMSLGYDCAVDHGVYVHHFRGKSLKANSLDRAELLRASNKLLYSKWERYITEYINERMSRGVDVVSQIKNGASDNHWLLHELDRDEHFTENYASKV